MTEEEKNKDLEIRRNEFLKRYKVLIDEMKLDFMSFPVLLPTKEGHYELRIQTDLMDTSNIAIPSPFQ